MAHARATSSNPTERDEEENDSQDRLFSLPDGKPALFLLHDFDDPNLAERIAEHGGQVTDDETTADVILTRSRDVYRSLKDRYAISRKTHVRVSGFVDRCIYAHRFVLVPTPGKGVPGRIPGARRTEFTEDDDEYLCQYIAEILPEKSEGGRTGHFIYTDLMRRADQFGQYTWAQRHTKDAWRERYRKNWFRLDQRIAEIVEENPPAPDGKGRYKSRRFGRLDQDELEGEEFMLDAEEGAESATDNEDGPVWAKRASTQPQKEEEEDAEEEYHLRSQDSYHEEEDDQEAQAVGRRSKAGPTPRSKVTRQKRWVSQGKTSAPKRRKAATWRHEVPSPNDLDSTLLDQDGDGQIARESSAPPVDAHDPATTKQHSLPAASPEPEHAEPETTKQTARRARPVAPPVRISPHQTRARSRLGTANLPDPTPASTRRRTASGAKTMAATPPPRRTRVRSRSSSVESLEEVAARAIVAMGKPTLEAVPESEPRAAHDEFVAHSEDEGDMQEVEVNLHIEAGFSGDDPHADSHARILSADDLQTSMRLRRAEGVEVVDTDEDEDEEDEDSSDAELLARVQKLDTRLAPPTPPRARAHRNLNRGEESEELSAEELVPPQGTRAQAEKSHRTQVAKGAPYVPPPGTRAAVMMEKGKGKATLRRE
ncbi:hypothetical protein EDB85DRAFT_2013370 [Lactarius pseudohatsudake]|nr:hypothetical protein EDB85DRAFT_2013370 [Lactarius pseudohatsudake]